MVGACSSADVIEDGIATSEQTLLTLPTPVANWNFDAYVPETGLYNGPGRITGVDLRVVEGPWRHNVQYDGVDDRLQFADASQYDFSSAMTAAAWARPTAASSGTQTILSKWGTSNAYKLEVVGTKYRFSIQIGTTTHYVEATATADRWTHVVGVYSGTQLLLYLNGVQAAVKAVTGSIANSSRPIMIGAQSATSNRFKGRIDNVQLYGSALSAAQPRFRAWREGRGSSGANGVSLAAN
jgi:hypothetical protein